MPEIVLCPKCQAQNPMGSQVCHACGTRWCLNCGASVPSASRYCPRCGAYAGSEQQARAAQRTAMASQPAQAPVMPPRPAMSPEPPAMATTGWTVPPSRFGPQPAIPHQYTQSQGMLPPQHVCPYCGGAIDISLGQCLSCGVLLSKNMLQKMQQQSTPAPTVEHHTTPRFSSPAPMPEQQDTAWLQQPGGFITGRQVNHPTQGIPIPSMPLHAAPVQSSPYQGIPVPRPTMHPNIPPQPRQGYTPAYSTPPPYHQPAPGYNQPYNIPHISQQQGTGLPPMPRAAGTEPPMAYTAQPMPLSGRVPHIVPSDQGFHPGTGMPPRKLTADSGYYSRGGNIPIARSGIPLLKALTYALFAVIGFIGIYFVVSQVGIPAVSETLSQPQASQPETIVRRPADSLLPEILNVAIASVTETSAVIKWQTDKPTTSQIILRDNDGTRTQTEPGAVLATDHRLTLSNLKAGTTYKYTVTSKDADGNQVSKEGVITTSRQMDLMPPLMSAVKVLSITESSVSVGWMTDEPATSQVKFGRTSSYGSDTPLDKVLTTNHLVTINGLSPDTEYHFALKSTDTSGNESVSATDNLFRTTPPISVGPYVGNRAPEFTLQDINGKSVSLSDFKGKTVMVNFWATWCGPCVAELPDFQAIYNTRSHDQLVILAIHVREQVENAKSYAESQKFTFPVLLDTTGTTASAYNISAIPRTFFIDRNGIIKKAPPAGGLDKVATEEILKSL